MAARKPLVVFGAGQIAEVAWSCFERDSGYEVVAFTVDREYLRVDTLCGRPVFAFDELPARLPPESHAMFVAIAYGRMNQSRRDTVARMQAAGYRCVNYVSSQALVAGEVVPDSNTFVMELNNLQPFSRLGRNVWLWAGNHIGHHSFVEDDCFVASHAVISGSVRIGAATFVGVNATIRDNVTIGRRNVIGAGVVILADTLDEQVYVATKTEPSRVPSHRLRGL
ncbi:MAG: acetyltransferase [Proteobacteria bacterium]|nr:acetyltransferase [Burkholderiales bacterium]